MDRTAGPSVYRVDLLNKIKNFVSITLHIEPRRASEFRREPYDISLPIPVELLPYRSRQLRVTYDRNRYFQQKYRSHVGSILSALGIKARNHRLVGFASTDHDHQVAGHNRKDLVDPNSKSTDTTRSDPSLVFQWSSNMRILFFPTVISKHFIVAVSV